MCGRYAASRRPEDLVEELAVDDVAETVDGPSWNVAPTDPVPLVRVGPTGRRELRVARWGLTAQGAGPARSGRLINARAETVASKPAFRDAFAARRGLLPADGYYEWTRGPGGRRQAWFIAPRDGSVLAMAGIYTAHPGPDGRVLWTAAVITTAAPGDLAHLHERTPLTVDPADRAAWLDPDRRDPGRLRGLLGPAAAGRLVAHPVGPAVGDVRRDGPQLVAPVAAPDVTAAVPLPLW